jgi:hypothetical protein
MALQRIDFNAVRAENEHRFDTERQAREQAQRSSRLPSDNPTVLAHILDQELPCLSREDLQVVAEAAAHRWKVLGAEEKRQATEAHYASLRALPVGTAVQYVGATDKDFAHGEIITLGRALRKPSPRIQVYDRNGTPWRMQMEYLRRVPEAERPV